MGKSALKILVVNSHVVAGHVGGRIQVPVLQALGHEAWHLPTVLFSNHPAHGGFAGEPVASALVADLLAGLDARGFRPDAVLSGYLGTAATASHLADYLDRLGSGVPFCCDPVLGDDGRLYVADGILEVMRDRLLLRADLATPNRFELQWLTRRTLDGEAAILDTLAGMRGLVACTSALDDGRTVTTIGHAGGEFLGVDVPRLDTPPHGTGDLFAAAFLARHLGTDDLARALASAAGIVDHVLRRSAAEAAELALPESLPDLVAGVPALTVRRFGDG